MQNTGALYQPEMRSLLVEFSTFDVSMMVSDYLRKVLLLVFSNTESRYKDLHVERQLAMRLLSRHAQIDNRFTFLFINELRGQSSSPVRSNNVHRLTKRMYANTGDEAAALERILKKEKPDFDIHNSVFDAVRYAHCLEGALQDSIELTTVEKDIVFRSWSGLFAETMRESYIKYIQVVLNGSELAPQVQQDFVDTIPFALDPRKSGPSRPRTAALLAG